MEKVEAHYRDYRARALEGAGDPDYYGLTQGEYGTALRHDAVLSVMPPLHNCTVLDLGCGTGLFLEKLWKDGNLPELYIGVDQIEEYGFSIADRAKKFGVLHSFYHKPAQFPFERFWSAISVDVVLAVGLVGFWGYHTYRQIRSLVRWMQSIAPISVITFPMIYDDILGDPNLVRYDPEDMVCWLGGGSCIKLEREFVLTFGQHFDLGVSYVRS
jgi:SAM-dependent methyltransferase